MFNDEKWRKRLALAITHYVYRNTEIEDYHSKSTLMDMGLYKVIYKIVDTKLKKVKMFQKYIDNYNATGTESTAVMGDLLKTVPEELKFKFMKYFDAVVGFMYDEFGFDWEDAKVIDCNMQGKSLAKFVLSGCFLECCQKGAILDDETMCYINKDIHNRIYTLLVNGYFN